MGLKHKLLQLPITTLSQSNFAGGTYRIKTSGYYKLTENIVFDPTFNRADIPPGIGWFAAIGVEVNNVLIDLNGFEIIEGPGLLNTQGSNVFAIIELDNSPFIGDKNGVGFGEGGSTYVGETTFVSANNVWIRNGKLGQSARWGIHGSRNKNILIEKLNIRDWEVAGIQLNSIFHVKISCCDISGNVHHIVVTLAIIVVNTIEILQGLVQQGVPGAAAVLADVQAFAVDNPSLRVPVAVPENSAYGILIKPGSFPGDPFPITPHLAEQMIGFSNGRISKNIHIENTFVHDIVAAPLETPIIGSNLSPAGTFINLAQFGIFGNIRWADLFNANGAFAPNELARGMAFAASVLLALPPGPARINRPALPTNLATILSAIVSTNSTAFFANTVPVFGTSQNNNFFNAGVFGIRIDVAEQVFYENITVESIRNIALPSIVPTTLPGYINLPTNFVPNVNVGNRAYGVSMAVTNFVRFCGIKVLNVSSLNSIAIGIDQIQDNYDTHIENALIVRIISYTTSTSGIVIGIRFKNESWQGVKQLKRLGFCIKKLNKNFNNLIECAKINELSGTKEKKYSIVNAKIEIVEL